MPSLITSLTIVYLSVTSLCEGNSPVTGEFPAQRASNAENVSIWWRHHVDTARREGEIWRVFYEFPSDLYSTSLNAVLCEICYTGPRNHGTRL